jgi:hypothetical protein
VKAYDWAGYKYRIKASGFGRVPSGYINVANSVTVKRNGRTVANNKASYRAKPGTYTVYYKSKIRKKTAYKATYLNWAEATASDCSVTSSTVTSVPSRPFDGYPYAGSFDVTYTGLCNGIYYTSDGFCDTINGVDRCITDYSQAYIRTLVEFVGTWTDSVAGSSFSTAADWEATRLINGTVKNFICDYYSYDDYGNQGECASYFGPTTYVRYPFYYTANRYGPVLTRYFKRTVKVVKKNSRIITPSEWKKLRSGLSVGEVSRLFGNPGKVSYVSGNLVSRAYRDLRYDGSYCNTYYLTFKNGKLYSWDNDQFTDRCVS